MNLTRTTVALIVSSLFASVACANDEVQKPILNSNEFDIGDSISAPPPGN